MILRQLSVHVRTQNWIAVGLDFLIVVIGVFVGLQVSNWNDARQDSQEAQSILLRLESDLETEIIGWQRGVEYYAVARDHGLLALEAYNAEDIADPTAFLVRLYQASQRWNLTSQRGTYDELISSGRISLIGDENMRARLANHYLRMSSLQNVLDSSRGEFQYRRTVRFYMNNTVQRAIRRDCGDTYVVENTNYFYLTLPELCSVELPLELAIAEAERLAANVEIEGELRFHVSVLDGQLAAMENAIGIADSTLAQVRMVRQGRQQ
ncbi:hypothetical protein [Hyphobacterium sp.]|uniref:hypothetical protein n=1 Tax=Hyphobacterium sp. TaxID=2004662 RepID=UPI0037486C98